MGDLQNLKGMVRSIAERSRTTSRNLKAFERDFRDQSAAIQQRIQTAAQGEDQQFAQLLKRAEEQVNAAVGALNRAADAADSWASRA